MSKPTMDTPTDPGGQSSSSHLMAIFHDFEPPVAEIVSRSLITSSFNREDRFEWNPNTGFRVSIPDRFSFVSFERATPAEIRNRLLPYSASQPKHLPERSLAWWYAQLIHYGLPITCDRDEAKESFKIAISRDRFFVPQRLRELEVRLKRQYVVTPSDRSGAAPPVQDVQQVVATKIQSPCQGGGQSQPLKKQSGSQRDTPRFTKTNNRPAHDCVQRSPSTATGYDQSPSGNSGSLSDTEDESTPKPAHLFTPHGARTTKSAEYTGLSDIPEEQRRQKVLRDLQKIQAKDKICGNKALPGMKIQSKPNLLNESSDDTDNSELVRKTDGLNDTSTQRTSLHKGKVKNGMDMSSGLSNLADKEMTDVQDLEDSSGDDTGSLQFYTPLQYLKHRSNHEDDQESIILTGHRSRPENEIGHTNRRAQKLSRSGKDIALVKSESNRPESQKGQIAKLKNSLANRKKPLTTKTQKTAKTQGKDVTATKRNSKLQRKRRQFIEISSDSSSDNEENEQDGSESDASVVQVHSGEHPRAMKIRPLKMSTDSIPRPDKPSTPKHIPSTSERPSSAAKPSIALESQTRQSMPSQKPTLSSPLTQTTASVSNPVAAGANKNKQNEQVVPEKGRRKRKRKTSERQGQTVMADLSSSTIKARNEIVRDLTGCGITEMSGGLHPADESVDETARRPEKQVRIRGPAGSLSQLSEPSQPQSSPPQSTDSQHSDSDLPSMTELFSSQQTPESWKTALKRVSAQRELERSYDPDSVPALREELATLPAYLKIAVRHDSPELSHSSPVVPVVKLKVPNTSKPRERSRSQSVSVLPVQRKRARPSMIEIEADNDRSSFLKQPRTSASQMDPASAALGLFKVNSQVKLPGPKVNAKSPKDIPTSKNERKKSKASTLVSKKTRVEDESHEPYDQRTARRRARSLGPVRKSVEP